MPFALQLLDGTHERPPDMIGETAPSLKRSFSSPTDYISATLRMEDAEELAEEDPVITELRQQLDQAFLDETVTFNVSDEEDEDREGADEREQPEVDAEEREAHEEEVEEAGAGLHQEAKEEQRAEPEGRQAPEASAAILAMAEGVESLRSNCKAAFQQTLSVLKAKTDKAKRSKRSFAERLCDRQREVSYLSRTALSKEAYGALRAPLRFCLWMTCNGYIFSEIELSLQWRNRFLLAQVAPGDGLAAFEAINQRYCERSSASRSTFLMRIMQTRFKDCGHAGAPPSIRNYVSTLQDRDADYASCNAGAGIDRSGHSVSKGSGSPGGVRVNSELH